MTSGDAAMSSGVGASEASGGSSDVAQRSRSQPFTFLESIGLGLSEETSCRRGWGGFGEAETEARIRAHASWEQYVDDRIPTGSRMAEIWAIFTEVNAIDLPAPVKIVASQALQNPVTRLMFQSFDAKCKLARLMSLGSQ